MPSLSVSAASDLLVPLFPIPGRDSRLNLTQAWMVAAVLVVITLLLYHRFNAYQRPPGPRGVPFFGNSLQVPLTHFATHLKDLHARYGDLVYLSLNHQHIFSIRDVELAVELMERRSAIYSSRAGVPFLERYADPGGYIWSFVALGENHHWGRRISSIAMKHTKAGHTEALQRLLALSLTRDMTDDKGKDWHNEMLRLSAKMIISVMYGINPINDNEVSKVDQVIELVQNTVSQLDPFYSIINLFPVIDDLLPSFVPTPWRIQAKEWVRQDAEGWSELFFEATEGKGAKMSTWASMFANEGKDRRLLLSTLVDAGTDSSAVALQSFILACIAFPEWIEAAQEELDRVVGKDRLPTFEDRPSLPFIEATMREVLRWNPPARLGIPHMSTADDLIEYKGKEYFIPKGSIIYAAPLVLEHDADRYDSPEFFHPQRFLDDKGQLKADYRTTSFGFGRRICVGVPFVERTLWIVIATILWTFDICKTTDPRTGLPFDYKTSDEAIDGRLTNAPFPFPVVFEPRDEHRVSVVRREWEDCEKDLNVLLPPLKASS